MQKFYYILLLTVFSINSSTQIATEQNKTKIDSIDNISYQPYLQEEEMVMHFLRPIHFSQDGIAHFFKYTYNHDNYTEFLPYNFSHMIQFLEFGKEQEQSELFAKSVIKLFLQKIKACSFVNAYSLIEMMPKFSKSMKPYIEKKEASFFGELKESLKSRFANIFSNYFSHFKKNPEAFLDALAEQIAKKTNDTQTSQHIEVEHIKKDVVRFLEICINKLVWSPEDGYEAWLSVNQLAQDSYELLQSDLITDMDALDDILWSLIHRFCYFVKISKHDLPQDFFVKVINDINSKNLILFTVEEQEDFITPKKEFLLNKLQKLSPQTKLIKKESTNNFDINISSLPI